MGFHSNEQLGSIHVPYNFEYADETARSAATGLVSSDVGKFARQLDDNTLWMLIGYSPVEWVEVGGAGAGSGDVVGPGSSVDNTLVRFDGTTGKAVQGSQGVIDDAGNLSGIASLNTFAIAEPMASTGPLVYSDTANKVVGPLANTPTNLDQSLMWFGGISQKYTTDYTLRSVVGGSAPGWYIAIATDSSAPGGGSFSGGSNPATGLSEAENGDIFQLVYNIT